MKNKKLLWLVVFMVMFISAIFIFSHKTSHYEVINKPIVSENESKLVTFNFLNEEYIESGNEELSKIKKVQMEVEKNENFYFNVVQLLMSDPNIEGAISAFDKSSELIQVYKKDNVLYVDFKKETINKGSSMSEEMILLSLVNTITSLDEIEYIQILLDGKIEETLQGHYLINEPLKNFNL